jgi:hypothetical protein
MILDSGILGTNILADAASVIVDVSNVVDSIETKRGRNPQADQFQTGTLTMRIVDQVGAFNPQNPASPYFQLLTPMRKVQITATYGATTYPIFAGFITSYTTTTPKNANDVVYTTITAVDAFRLAQNAQVSTVAGTSAGQLSGARINNLLDAIDWPLTMRDVDAGLTTMQADPGTARTSLAAIKNAEFSETGAFYMDTSGTAVFKSRAQIMASLAASPTAFNQTGGIPYKNLKYAFDDKLIINQANLGRVGGTVQVVTNQTSVDKYFPHSVTQTDLVAETDTIVSEIAKEYIATRQETTIRIDEMTVDLLDTAVPTDTMIGLDYFDNLLITNIQPDGSTIVKNLQFQGINWSITPNKMTAIITTLEPIADGFIVGNTYGYGTIGVSTLGY